LTNVRWLAEHGYGSPGERTDRTAATRTR